LKIKTRTKKAFDEWEKVEYNRYDTEIWRRIRTKANRIAFVLVRLFIIFGGFKNV